MPRLAMIEWLVLGLGLGKSVRDFPLRRDSLVMGLIHFIKRLNKRVIYEQTRNDWRFGALDTDNLGNYGY